jgi:glycosyltransferase involved in cell wall biosynthesis
MAEMADVVVYQSEWAKEYCMPLTGDGAIIYNGVNTQLFKPTPAMKPDHDRYLFAYHGKSELKGFWTAHAYFQKVFRDNPQAEFWFINDFGRDLDELQKSKFDFWNGEKYRHLPFAPTPEQMAMVMQQCTHLLFPSIADASPNTVLEARATGLKVHLTADKLDSGTEELLDPQLDITLERMGDEYYAVLKMIMQTV